MRPTNCFAAFACLSLAGVANASVSSPDITGAFYLNGYIDREHDVDLGRVDFNNGTTYRRFIYADRVHSFEYSGPTNRKKMSINKGQHVTTLGEKIDLRMLDGDGNNVSDTDRELFADAVKGAFRNANLNHYVDISGGGVTFSFVVEFERPIKDNDAGDDQVPELLYFERGANGSNSSLTIEALDADGNPIGHALVLMPDDAVHTIPRAQVTGGQYMSAVPLDLSKLGVDEVTSLRIRTPRAGDLTTGGYTYPGGEQAPDFKLVAVQTYDTPKATWYGD